MSNGEKVKLNVRVSEHVKEEAHVMAIRSGVSLQDLVETALLEYMARQTEGERGHGGTYKDGDRVEFTVDGDVSDIRLGTVRGIVSRHFVDFWIVVPETPITGWPYSALLVQSSFMRRVGENRPFECENLELFHWQPDFETITGKE